nr:hypothetical protein [uncultured Bacteroides sp.]
MTQPSKEEPSQSDKPSEAKALSHNGEASRAKQRLPIPQPHPSDGAAEQPERPASFFLREEIGRIVAKRRGCCLSEASFTPFRYKPLDFSKKNAALIFCFFLIKQKEKAFVIFKKPQIKPNKIFKCI